MNTLKHTKPIQISQQKLKPMTQSTNISSWMRRATLLCANFIALSLTMTAQAQLTNYGDPATMSLQQALNHGTVHIMQIGDSHTAGDMMTHAMRQQLQSALGNGGIGYAMPMWFSGQRMALISYDNRDFSPISSRHNSQESYTLGGMIARPKNHGASLTLKPKTALTRQRFIVSIKQDSHDGAFVGIDAEGQRFQLQAPIKNNTWQLTQINATLPLTITADNAINSSIGGWWGTNEANGGAIISALGINGAQINYWNRWQATAWQNELAFLRPHLIILEYGTNEAHSGIDIDNMINDYNRLIAQIRKASPNSAIMLMTAPDSLKNNQGQCGTRPTNLNAIQQAQRQIAQTQHTLLWDWASYMGGNCSMISWINQGLAAKDGVHFSHAGYQKIGIAMANDILSFKKGTPPTPTSTRTTSTTPSDPTANNMPTNQGYIQWSK